MSIIASVPRAPRFALEVPVRIRRVGTDGWESGHTVNISRSGLLVAVPSAIQRGDAIDAIVQLSDATATVADVILRGQVTRVAYVGSLTHVATTIDEYRLQQPDAFEP